MKIKRKSMLIKTRRQELEWLCWVLLGNKKRTLRIVRMKKTNAEKVVKLAAGPAPDASKICYKCEKAMAYITQADDTQIESAESDMDRVTMEKDDIHEISEEEKEKLNDVEYLTRNPLPSNVLLYAVPVCGPYNAVKSYKYRVKIIPGSL